MDAADTNRLAVHEEKINKQHEIDGVLFAKIDELRDKMDGDHDKIRARLSLMERRIWTAVGALGAAVILSNPGTFKMMKPLFAMGEGAIVSPAVAVVDGSR